MRGRDLDDADLLDLCDLARRAAAKIRNEGDAHDISQIAIEKLVLSDKEFEDLEHVKAWVQKVVKNAAKDRDRMQRRNTEYDEDAGIRPESFTTDLVARQKIHDLIDRLPEKYQGVIELTYFVGLSASEVGDRLGYSTATVHKMLSEARAMLRPDITAPPGFGD